MYSLLYLYIVNVVLQAEAPLLIQPYLQEVSRSEMFAILTGGFASIAGAVLGAYAAFGVSICCFYWTERGIERERREGGGR